jgi:hypothetical protein
MILLLLLISAMSPASRATEPSGSVAPKCEGALALKDPKCRAELAVARILKTAPSCDSLGDACGREDIRYVEPTPATGTAATPAPTMGDTSFSLKSGGGKRSR